MPDKKHLHSITIASPFVKQSLVGAIDVGYDVNSVLAQCGIPAQILQVPQARVTLDQFVQLLRKLVVLMNDEAIGLLERPLRRGHLKLMGYSVITADTIGESWHRAVRYLNLFENGFTSELQESGDYAEFRVRRRSKHAVKNSLIIEQQLMTLHRFHAWMANRRIPITRVSLDYPAPNHVDEYRFLFYSSPVTFNQPYNSITFDRSALNLPNTQSTTSLESFIKRAPLDLFIPLSNTPNLSSKIRVWLEEELKSSQRAPSLEEACSKFDLNGQTLRRRLHKEGTSYQTIKLQARRDYAIHLLNDSKLSVESISHQLGFSEPSAFIRAFKTWTGLTPLGYRKT